MQTGTLTLRSATHADLDAINRVIEAAIRSWDLPGRVKRLALPTYRYSDQDVAHLDMVVAWQGKAISGVAAWEPVAATDRRALLLHGLYVHPDHQRRGIGSRLLEAAIRAARERGADGLLVRVQAGAEEFFEKQGFQRLPVDDVRRDYAGRYWLPFG